MPTEYWNHNTAYHAWILRHVSGASSVLDVGCGDGLLLERLSPVCARVTGIEPAPGAADRARGRTENLGNVRVIQADFMTAALPPASHDAIIFSASLHHMDEEAALRKAADLLSPGGLLLVVGLAKPETAGDFLVEALRVIPAKIGSLLRDPEKSLGAIRGICASVLPGAKIRRGLYYRYLLRWRKP